MAYRTSWSPHGRAYSVDDIIPWLRLPMQLDIMIEGDEPSPRRSKKLTLRSMSLVLVALTFIWRRSGRRQDLAADGARYE